MLKRYNYLPRSAIVEIFGKSVLKSPVTLSSIILTARIKEVVRAAGVKPVESRVRQQLLLRKLESFEQDNFDESCFDEPVEQNEDDLDEDGITCDNLC